MTTSTTRFVGADPCVGCTSTGGYIPFNADRPKRIDGGSLGKPGPHCVACYRKLDRLARLKPCEQCGDPKGHKANPEYAAPSRYRIATDSQWLAVCHACKIADTVRRSEYSRDEGVTLSLAEAGERVALTEKSRAEAKRRAKVLVVETFAAMGAMLTVVGITRFTLADLTPQALSRLIRHEAGETFRAVYRDGLAPPVETPWRYQESARRAVMASPRGRGYVSSSD